MQILRCIGPKSPCRFLMMAILTGVRWQLTVVLPFRQWWWRREQLSTRLLAVSGSWRNVCVFCPCFDWVFLFSILSCMSWLYVFEINSLLVESFANIFSHPQVAFSCCLWLPLLCRSLKVEWDSICFVSFVFPSLWEMDPRKHYCSLCQRVCLCFPLGILEYLVLHVDL